MGEVCGPKKKQCLKRFNKVSPNKNAVFVMNTPGNDSGGLTGAGSAVCLSNAGCHTCSARTMSQNTTCMRCKTFSEPLQGRYHKLIRFWDVSLTVRPRVIDAPEAAKVTLSHTETGDNLCNDLCH